MYNPNYQSWGPQGWRCPECGRVYSPTTPMCFYCSNKETTIQTDKTTVIPFDDKGWWDDYQKRTTGDAEALNQLWKQFTVSSGISTAGSGEVHSEDTNVITSYDSYWLTGTVPTNGNMKIEITPSGAIIGHGTPPSTILKEWM